ncbi:hypothetical protein PQQ86_20195 [Paraburkholderia sediminicola]|jgi:glyoxylase I family protein|uniref:hypothetical protein n=1 Tax=Paraburkholderia sediminicola TaxID=458836 RepID=UPI0038B974D0
MKSGSRSVALNVEDLHAAPPHLAPYGRHAQGSPQAISTGPRAGTLVMYVVGPGGATIELRQPPA